MTLEDVLYKYRDLQDDALMLTEEMDRFSAKDTALFYEGMMQEISQHPHYEELKYVYFDAELDNLVSHTPEDRASIRSYAKSLMKQAADPGYREAMGYEALPTASDANDHIENILRERYHGALDGYPLTSGKKRILQACANRLRRKQIKYMMPLRIRT